MTKRLLREPLVHFLGLALVIFAAYSALRPASDTRSPEAIIVTAPKIAQFAGVFAKIWQRPPTDIELKGLIDDYVEEEIYVREALALGLDKDDTVIRHRLRLKMEFMNDAAADTRVPTDAELEAHLKAHPDAFAAEPMTAFQQVFLSPQKHADAIEKDTATILAKLETTPAPDASTLGDATLLPFELPLTGKSSIAQTFGPEFADALDKMPAGAWAGPVVSGYGSHLVRVLERKAGGIPALAEARDAVAREWRTAKHKELADARLSDLLKKYRITIETSSGASASQ